MSRLDIALDWRHLMPRDQLGEVCRLELRDPDADLRASPAPWWPFEVGSRRGIVIGALAVILIGVAAGVALGLDHDAVLALVREHHRWLLGFVAGAPVMASLLFMVIYALAVAISIPGLAALTVLGGYLFGWLSGTAYVLIATTLAATAVFVLARSAIGGPLRARAGPSLVRFADAFRSNALSYVLVLHLVPIFPYAMVIGIPAACGVRVRTFVVSAFLGLLPGTLLFAHLGSGLGDLLQAGLPLGIGSFLRPEIVLPLLGLSVLALLPVVYRGWYARGNV
jgi:uncharacterized membrane protein YdjX (TVP38/TMEM64 family)